MPYCSPGRCVRSLRSRDLGNPIIAGRRHLLSLLIFSAKCRLNSRGYLHPGCPPGPTNSPQPYAPTRAAERPLPAAGGLGQARQLGLTSRHRGTPKGSRRLTCFYQALFALAWFRSKPNLRRELGRGVLTAAVTMKDHPVDLAASRSDRRRQRVADQIGPQMVGDRPADQALRPDIDQRREIQPRVSGGRLWCRYRSAVAARTGRVSV